MGELELALVFAAPVLSVLLGVALGAVLTRRQINTEISRRRRDVRFLLTCLMDLGAAMGTPTDDQRVCPRCQEAHRAEDFRGSLCGWCADDLERQQNPKEKAHEHEAG